MRDFFKPWRRKVGVVTLVLACAVVNVWVRSIFIEDNLIRFTPDGAFYELLSTHGYFVWWSSFKHYFPENSTHVVWNNLPAHINHFDLEHYCSETPCLLNRIGIGIRHYEGENRYNGDVWAIPYWSIVIPLTLLAAWLLLTKPRPAKKPEPAPTTGAGHA